MKDWNNMFGIPNPLDVKDDTLKTLEGLAYPLGRNFDAIHRLTQNSALLQQQKMLKALAGSDIFTSGFEVPKMPKTAIDVFIGMPGWHISNYIDSLSSIASPQTAMNAALTGLTRTLIDSTKSIIEEAEIEETEKQESYEAIEKLERQVENKKTVTQEDIINLKEHFDTRIDDLIKQGKISEARGHISNFLFGIIFFLFSLAMTSDSKEESRTTTQGKNTYIEQANDSVSREDTARAILNLYGLRQTTANVNLRSMPGTATNSTILLTIPNGTYVEIIDNSVPYWAKVKCDNPKNPDLMIEGWVSKRYLGAFIPN